MTIRPAFRGISLIGRITLAAAAVTLVFSLWSTLSILFGQIFFGIFLAYTALPLARLLERHLSVSLSALFSVGLLLVGAIGVLALLFPHIIAQISLVIAQAPALLSRLQALWSELTSRDWIRALGIDTSVPQEWLKTLGAWLGEQLPRLLSTIGEGANAISKAFLSPLLAFYFLRDREIFSYRLCLWIPARYRKRALCALQEMRREATSYIRGQLLISLCVGGLTALGLLLAGIPAWLVLGLLMGICELIPYVGPLIGAVPIAIFSLPLGPGSFLWAMGIVISVQQIEGWFLSPHLMAGATGLHPVSVVLLLSAGGLLWGLAGMVIILPLFLCLRGAGRILYETRERKM